MDIQQELLREIPNVDDKAEMWDYLTRYFPDVIRDTEQRPMHPVVFDNHGVARWKADPLIKKLSDCGLALPRPKVPLDLNLVPLAVHRGTMTDADQRELARRLGYSLDGYCGLSYVQERLQSLDQP